MYIIQEFKCNGSEIKISYGMLFKPIKKMIKYFPSNLEKKIMLVNST